MPIRLNIQNQTTVTPEFMDVLVDIWKERWKALNDEILQASPRMRDFHAKKNAPMMSRMKAACTDKTARDYEKTQLLCLPFVKFWTLEHRGAQFLVGLTKPITLTDLSSKRWQGPRYTIYVPRQVTTQSTSAAIHWIPEGYELDWARHPHHKAYMPDPPVSNPLDMTPSTCWGTFGQMTQSCVRGGEVSNLFRTLHLYTSRVDMNSLLVHPFEACRQFTPLPDSQPEPAIRPTASMRSTTTRRRAYR